MESGAVKKLSSLIKNRAAAIAGLNQAAIAGLSDREMQGFSMVPISVFASSAIGLAAKSVFGAISFLAWRSGRNVCNDSQEVIAALSSVSPRQVRSSIAELVTAGFVSRERQTKGRYAGALRLAGVNDAPQTASEAGTRCATCKTQRPTGPLGVCVVCRKQERADDEVKRFLEDGPAPYELVYLKLTANGSTCGRRAIQRAYIKATMPERVSA